jgi:hypothetical protein
MLPTRRRDLALAERRLALAQCATAALIWSANQTTIVTPRTRHLSRARPAWYTAHPLASTSLSLIVSAVTCSVILNPEASCLLYVLVLAHEAGHYIVARAGGLALTGPLVLLPLGGLVPVSCERAERSARPGWRWSKSH